MMRLNDENFIEVVLSILALLMMENDFVLVAESRAIYAFRRQAKSLSHLLYNEVCLRYSIFV